MNLQKRKPIVEVFKFLLLYILISHSIFSYDLYSPYQNLEAINLEKINSYLEEKHYFQKQGNLLPQSIEAIEYMHPYATSMDKFINSKYFLNSILKNSHKMSDTLLISVLEIIYTAFKDDFIRENENIFLKTENPRLLAISYLYLHRKGKISRRVQKKFELHISYNYLSSIRDNLQTMNFSLPSLNEILWMNFPTDGYIIYVLRKDLKSILVIKKNKNNFLRDSNGEVISFSVNSRSVLELPFYLPMGDTPQGIFKIGSTAKSSNPRIGPTPVIQLQLPFEISTEEFYPESKSNIWSKEYYAKILPESWKTYIPIFQSYEAGKNGRRGIWIHGSTLDPNKFTGLNDRNTMTYGCISLPEEWERGVLKESSQLDLLNLLGERVVGYVVVLDIDDLGKGLEEIKKPQ